MSAIVGRIHLSGRPVDEIVFHKAHEAISQYGGYGSGSLVDGCLAMGHHNFQVMRRSAVERQPVISEGLIVVADAILDNRVDLCASLGIPSYKEPALSDSALILQAYRKWGKECVHHLLGDYAFAVWDSEHQNLFLTRDHIGTRPLYWRIRNDEIIFATDIRALVAFNDFVWEINEEAVLNYLSSPTAPMKAEFFHGLEACPAGTFMTFGKAGVAAKRWWDPANAVTDRLADGKAYAQKLRELAEQAIKARIDTDLRIGSHISGGIDSTSITIMAQRQLSIAGKGLFRGYTWAPAISDIFPEMGQMDERRAIYYTHEKEGVPIAWGTIKPEHIERLIKYPVEFFGSTDLADELPVIENASNDGIGLMLSGWGGDEAFSAWGIGYPAMLLKSGQIRKLAGHARHKYRNAGIRATLDFLWSDAIHPLLLEGFPTIRSRKIPSFDARSYLAERTGSIRSSPLTDAAPLDPNQRIRFLLLRGHIGTRMATWAALSADKGYIYRYPLTDKRLLEFAVHVPAEYLMQKGVYRALAYTALADLPLTLFRKFDSANELARARARREFARTNLKWGLQDCHFDKAKLQELKKSLDHESRKVGSSSSALDIEIYKYLSTLRTRHLFPR